MNRIAMPAAVSISSSERARAVKILNRLFARRYHSLSRYIVQAAGHVPDADRPLVRLIEEIGAWDAAEAENLSQTIESLDGIPQVDIMDAEFAELNYLSIRYLAGVLRKTLAGEREVCQEALSETRSCLPAHRAVRRVADGIDRHVRSIADSGLTSASSVEPRIADS